MREEKEWSQTDLADKSSVSHVMTGKYERDEAVPSVEVSKKIADTFGVSLDYLTGECVNAHFDIKTLQRIQEPELLGEDKKKTLFDLMDTYIRDAKTRKAFAAR